MRKEAGKTASFQRRVYWGEYLKYSCKQFDISLFICKSTIHLCSVCELLRKIEKKFTYHLKNDRIWRNCGPCRACLKLSDQYLGTHGDFSGLCRKIFAGCRKLQYLCGNTAFCDNRAIGGRSGIPAVSF